MTCTEEYREHIEYTFHAFCKVVIRNATINAARTRSRKHKREISLGHGPAGTGRTVYRECGYTPYACYVTVSTYIRRFRYKKMPAKCRHEDKKA